MTTWYSALKSAATKADPSFWNRPPVPKWWICLCCRWL